MTHSDVCRSYSDDALVGIISDLSMSGGWPVRLAAAINEMKRRLAEFDL